MPSLVSQPLAVIQKGQLLLVNMTNKTVSPQQGFLTRKEMMKNIPTLIYSLKRENGKIILFCGGMWNVPPFVSGNPVLTLEEILTKIMGYTFDKSDKIPDFEEFEAEKEKEKALSISIAPMNNVFYFKGEKVDKTFDNNDSGIKAMKKFLVEDPKGYVVYRVGFQTVEFRQDSQHNVLEKVSSFLKTLDLVKKALSGGMTAND